MKINWKIYRALAKIILVVLVLVFLGSGIYVGMKISGKNKLYNKSKGQAPTLNLVELESENKEEDTNETAAIEIWQEGDIRYQGKIYRYNEDMLTFLFMGVDKMEEVETAKDEISGGQADALFLLALNPHTQEMSVIAINRDTMTDIDAYDKDGSFIGTVKGQITLQHGYGDGRTSSCERSVKAVSNLFYQLPIHGYCAINMGAIPLINDAVGGVELTALENINVKKYEIKEGEQVLLEGLNAYWYIRYRNTNVFNSAGTRLERQKQYLKAYLKKAKEETKKDITLPVNVYGTISKYMVTDVTIDEVSYLASEGLGYQILEENFYTIPGETIKGESFEEFYPNEVGLYELILQVFYEEMN